MFVWPRAVIAASLMLLATSAAPMSADQTNPRGGQSRPRQASSGDRFFEATNIRLADVEHPKATGGIIALYPRAVDARTLAIPGGEPSEYLHLTLVYFGDDVSDIAESKLPQVLDDLTTARPHPIEAQVFGHGTLNPNDKNVHTAVVYLVGDSPDLIPLRQRVLESSEQLFPVPAQHEPWVPHITADYGPSDAVLTYTGPVVFDRIGLSSAGHTTYLTLGDC
jgi:2'-5' RNA ligase